MVSQTASLFLVWVEVETLPSYGPGIDVDFEMESYTKNHIYVVVTMPNNDFRWRILASMAKPTKEVNYGTFSNSSIITSISHGSTRVISMKLFLWKRSLGECKDLNNKWKAFKI